MKITIDHFTTYEFTKPLVSGFQQVRLTPSPSHIQDIKKWTTTFTNAREQVSYLDHHQNRVQLIQLEPGFSTFTIHASGEVLVNNLNGISPLDESPCPNWLYLRTTRRTTPGVRTAELIQNLEARDQLSAVHDLMLRVRENLTFDPESSATSWTAEEVLREGYGVCQDFTHVLVAATRALNIPSRYVSGYLSMGDGTEQSAMHAWAETFIDKLGWVGLDATNGISPDEHYIRVAVGLDLDDAAPGIGCRVGGVEERLRVHIQINQQ